MLEEGCPQEKTIAEHRKAMTCTLKGHREMQRLKRVFNIDIEKCERCSGHVKVVSSIEDPEVIEKILQHLALKESPPLPRANEERGPPDQNFRYAPLFVARSVSLLYGKTLLTISLEQKMLYAGHHNAPNELTGSGRIGCNPFA